MDLDRNELDRILARCRTLKGEWSTRNAKFRKWYDVLRLKDELAQDGMESVVSNDPRTGYNLARHLLVNAIVAHKINQVGLEAEQITATSYLEEYITRQWQEHEYRYRASGKQGWIWNLVSWMMATGWVSVFSVVEGNRIWSEVWNPADVFPGYGEDGLVEAVHIYPVSAAAANYKARKMGASVQIRGSSTIYDYHWFDADGDVANCTILGTQYLKPPTKDVQLSKVHRLPVLCRAVGGLPDTGSIDTNWQEHYGEALVATNEEMIKNYNKMLTYTQQLMRDTANPRWLELSNSENGILQAENLFKRGAIFRGAPGETVTPLPTPPIPVELRQLMLDYQNMIQRGAFPWSVFGNIQQQMSYLAMASVASASMQVLSPYVGALEGLLTDMDNYWVNVIRENKLAPDKYKPPAGMPVDSKFDVQVDIDIPGYLIQRATVARMLNPSFKLSTTTVMDKLFPEVSNPLQEQAGARKDDALNHPKAVMADSIIAYREQARVLREAGDADAAQVYEKLAASLEIELGGQPPAQIPGQQVPAREVAPTRESIPLMEELNR
jgi:hypothetical protein